MSYRRVIPRDLFNEAKLLNCLGRLYIKSELTRRVSVANLFEGSAEPFRIFQDESDGSLECVQIHCLVNGNHTRLFTPCNDRGKWPLWARFNDEDVQVFDDNGELTPEFLNLGLKDEDHD